MRARLEKTFEQNAVVTVWAKFTKPPAPFVDPDCCVPPVAVDPTTVTLRLMSPSMVRTDIDYDPNQTAPTPEDIARSDVGEYSAQVVLDEAGEWSYRWEGTGTCQAVDEGKFAANGSVFAI